MKDGIKFVVLIVIALAIIFIVAYVSDRHKNGDKYIEREMQSVSEKCRSAALNRNFTFAHDLLNQLENDFISYNGRDDILEKKKKRYEEDFDYVFNAEAMYLCSKGDKESLDRLIFLLASIPEKGVPLPEGTEYETAYELGNASKDHADYLYYAIRFNQKCNTLIDLAIAKRLYYIIENVTPLYKPITEPIKSEELGYQEQYGIVSKKYKKQKVLYNQKMKEQAIAKVNKAIKDGVFSNIIQEVK